MDVPVYYEGEQVGTADVVETSDFVTKIDDPEQPLELEINMAYKPPKKPKEPKKPKSK